MGIILQYRRCLLVICAIIITVLVMVKCTSTDTKAKESTGPAGFEQYTGSEKCVTCHKEVHDSYIQTAHYLTGQPATENYIKGSFQKGRNTYSYTPSILLSMEKRDSGFYQVAYFKGEEKKAMRFDIVIGSATMGQSFLTWRGNRLFQLPITYFSAADQWSNSPGFPSDKVLIDRPVTSRCLECHTTFAQGISGPAMDPVEFDHNKIIYGVDCEKCHGPAAQHVEFHTAHPQEKAAMYIVNPNKLSRELQLDVCALCHSGHIEKTKPSFEFAAGKNLSDYFTPVSLSDMAVSSGNVDVHGNQYGLLRASKCFKLSTTLTCNSCHNTHQSERNKLEVFSARCITCHNTTSAEFKTPVHAGITAIEKNCIDCHMPNRPSQSIAVQVEGEELPRASYLRSHLIAVYPDETKKFKNQHSK